MDSTNPVKDAYTHGTEQIQELEFEGIKHVVLPQNSKLESLLALHEIRAKTPHRINSNVTTQSIESFIEYFNRYSNKSSTVFIDYNNAHFEGILDYHESTDSPRHGNHLVKYTCPPTKEWNAWKKLNNEKMDQETFALFIEDNLNEVVDPNGADMLEIAQTLKATSSVSFRSSKMLDNGQTQLTYVEEIEGSAGASGQLEIPSKIKLQLPFFQHGTPYNLEARFRYRINRGHLSFWYTLVRPHLSVDDAINGIVDTVKSSIERGHVYLGTK